MADVIGLDGLRRDPLEEAIQLSFHERGQAMVEKVNLDVSTAEWRTTARRVARALGRRVRTIETTTTLYAVLTDWPIDDRERAIHAEAVRDAARAVSGVSVTNAMGDANA